MASARLRKPWPPLPQQAGAEIRTGAEVIEVRVKDGAATGVVLVTGEEITAKAIVSNADPKRTLVEAGRSGTSLSGFRPEVAALPDAGNIGESKPRAFRIAQIHCIER